MGKEGFVHEIPNADEFQRGKRKLATSAIREPQQRDFSLKEAEPRATAKTEHGRD